MKNFNREKKEEIVRSGQSKILKDWQTHSSITEEQFIEAINWTCADEFNVAGLTRTGWEKLRWHNERTGSVVRDLEGRYWPGSSFTFDVPEHMRKCYGDTMEQTQKNCSLFLEPGLKTMPKAIDIPAGQKFGDWTVLYKTGKRPKSGNKFYRCKCSCGTETDVRADKLLSGQSTSCGKCLTASLRRVTSHKLSKANSSGHKGVRWNKKDRRWEAAISFKGQYHYLGQYVDKAEAISAREAAERNLRSEYEH